MIPKQQLAQYFREKLQFYSEADDTGIAPKYRRGATFRTLFDSVSGDSFEIGLPPASSAKSAIRLFGSLLWVLKKKQLKVNKVVETPSGIAIFCEHRTSP